MPSSWSSGIDENELETFLSLMIATDISLASSDLERSFCEVLKPFLNALKKLHPVRQTVMPRSIEMHMTTARTFFADPLLFLMLSPLNSKS